MKIMIAGGTGFIGTHVSHFMIQEGHSVSVLSRHIKINTHSDRSTIQLFQWDGYSQGSWSQECEGADVVINLSGAPIADARWTAKRKQELIDSRVQSTQALLKAIQTWETKPHTFISASGIGFYGDRGDDVVNESSTPGEGFLSQLCQILESSAMEGKSLGLRVIPLRIGMVLGPDGGALSKMTFPFRVFLGGPILPGSQYVSWIHHQDLARLILFLSTHSSMQGPVNAVAPDAILMRDFCRTLGKTLNRPSWFPVPEFVLKILLGELTSMLTTGQRVEPKRVLQNGFTFSYPTLSHALDDIFTHPSSLKE